MRSWATPQGYASEQEALASLGGNAAAGRGTAAWRQPGLGSSDGQDHVFLVKRVSIVGGRDFRDASAIGVNDTGKQGVNFVLTNAGGEKFYDYTSAHIGSYMAIVHGRPGQERRGDQGRHPRQGPDRGPVQQAADRRSFAHPAHRRPAGQHHSIEERTVGASLGADSIKQGVTRPSPACSLSWSSC
jgi:preprotein translocase subunit SecD